MSTKNRNGRQDCELPPVSIYMRKGIFSEPFRSVYRSVVKETLNSVC